LFQKMKLIKAY